MLKLFVLLFCFVSVRNISANPIENIDAETGKNPPTYTPHQQMQLEKFRIAVADVLEDDSERSDEYLLGFLKNRKWEIYSAEQMLKIAKNWKESEKHNFKELAKSNFSQEMLKNFPVKLEGFDKMGCPLIQVQAGSWNVADYILKQEFVRDGVKNVMKHYWQIVAKAELRNRNNFPKCHQTRIIASLEHYNATNFSEVNSMSTVVKMIGDWSNYFPSFILALHYVEVPESFKPMLEMVRTNLNGELYGLITIHEGENWKQDLYNVVEIDQLGKKFGGTAHDI